MPTLRSRHIVSVGSEAIRAFLAGVAFWIMIASPSEAKPGDRLDRSVLTRTFEETFDRPLDLNKRWKPQFATGDQSGPFADGSRTLTSNGEQQLYVDPDFAGTPVGDQQGRALNLNPFEVDTSRRRLTITADRTPFELLARLWGGKYRFTSGLLTTQRSFSQTYGYFEIRTQVPRGRGLWSAFWMLPVERVWPPELDVFEILGDRPDVAYCSLHVRQRDGRTGGFQARMTGRDASASPVTFGLLWKPETLTWYRDDVEVCQTRNPGLNKPMYLLINLAVGGRWPGAPDRFTQFPARMIVEYVRAYALRR